MNGGCHCGRVTVRVPHAPLFINDCNCTLCFKRGVLWGYYPAGAVAIDGATRAYLRADVATPRLASHFCGDCGCATHWTLIDGEDRMGVNMRLFDPAELRGIEVRYGDRRNHDKAAARTYHEPTVFDGAGATA